MNPMTEQSVIPTTNLASYSFLPDDFVLAEKNPRDKEGSEQPPSRQHDTLRLFARNKASVFALLSLLLLGLMAIIGPEISGYSAEEQTIQNQNLAPRIPFLEEFGIFDGREQVQINGGKVTINRYHSTESTNVLEQTYYWCGSDSLGRDIFTRTCVGTRISLYVALVAVLVDLIFGMSYGMISGYFGGKVDLVMQRFCEILNGIPTLVMVTLLMMVLKPGLTTITLALALTSWVGMSKVARTQVLRLKEQEFVLAAKTLGANDFAILLKEILPNSFGQLITMTMLSIPNAIFMEAFLAFVGLGVPPPMASLGSLISDFFKSFTTHPYMILPPVLVLALLMLCFNLLADGIRDALDPMRKEQ